MTIWKQVAGAASASRVLSRSLAFGLVAALPFALAFAGAQPAKAKPVSPDEDGLGYCVLYDQGDNETNTVGPNKCCYEERTGNGDDLLTVCLQCDADWKNCEEVASAPGQTGGQTRAGPARSGGSISQPSGKPKRNRTKGAGGVLN
jgi:hypothetical protein